MIEFGTAAIVFVLLLAGTGVGVIVRPLLPEEHRKHETVQLIQLVIGMMVTLAALVLGLMTASAKNSFDTTSNDMRAFSATLIELDADLRLYGPDTAPVRKLLRTYTAAAIASTWQDEPAPAGNYYPTPAQLHGRQPSQLENTQLGEMLTGACAALRRLEPSDTYHRRLLDDSMTRCKNVIDRRWRLIEEAHSSMSRPFLMTLSFWLFVIFLSFGLIAPRNALALVMVTLGAMAIGSAIYVIVDLDTPLSGPIMVSSQPVRDALAHQLRE